MISVCDTKLPGVKTIQLDPFEDFRGEYVELYNKEIYTSLGITVDFVQDDISTSHHNVLRGIHGDGETWKLVSCLYGRFYLVVVNCDRESPDFGKWQSFTLTDRNRLQVLIPPRHGNGHVVLSDYTIFHYKQNTTYNPQGQFTYVWNDPALGIWWPCANPVLSRRDQAGRWVD